MKSSAGLSGEIQYVKGVGPARVKLLNKIGIYTVEDMLYYFPREWVDRTDIKPIRTVVPGEKHTVKGVVSGAGTRRVRGNLRITSVLIRDESGYISGVWYNQAYMEKALKKGDTVIFHGKVETFRGNLQMPVPEYEVVSGEENISVNRIVPIYPLTDKLTQKQVRKIVKYCIDNYLKYVEEYMPAEILARYSLPGIAESVSNVHFPENIPRLSAAKRRIIFDEFFILQYALALRKKRIKQDDGIIIKSSEAAWESASAEFDFELTGAQKRTLSAVKDDFSSGKPMNRLLQGDVGSGKTAVAFISAAVAAKNGFQAAIMAPTEILARQHMKNGSDFFEKSGLDTVLLLGGMKKSERDAAVDKIKNGEASVVIGTHALLQEDIEFSDLGFVVVDEQHRFGVMQRAALVKKGKKPPHVLIMTATPIPRTLSLTVYGDTDVSVIDELPPGRKPVKTVLFSGNDKERLLNFIREKIRGGGQVYAVYPLVEDSDKLDLKSAIEMEKEWAAGLLGYKTALVHGRMKKDEKEAVMEGFKKREIAVLVSTTVIEVGIDVPNASVMVIEHAERFGLSQLHQLRGRVGRGSRESWCVLVGDPATEDGFKRLNIMVNTNDGFRISEEDLAIRGPGEFMGVRQHGVPEFRMANLIRDREILETARKAAFEAVSGNGGINHKKNRLFVDIILKRYGKTFNLINFG